MTMRSHCTADRNEALLEARRTVRAGGSSIEVSELTFHPNLHRCIWISEAHRRLQRTGQFEPLIRIPRPAVMGLHRNGREPAQSRQEAKKQTQRPPLHEIPIFTAVLDN